MPTVANVNGISIIFKYNDYPPPHFHAIGGHMEAVICIADLTIMRSNLTKSHECSVISWAKPRRQQLALAWVLARSNMPLGQIGIDYEHPDSNSRIGSSTAPTRNLTESDEYSEGGSSTTSPVPVTLTTEEKAVAISVATIAFIRNLVGIGKDWLDIRKHRREAAKPQAENADARGNSEGETGPQKPPT